MRTFEMRAEIPNADGVLKPGQFVRVTLAGAVRNNALTVPQTAVLDGAPLLASGESSIWTDWVTELAGASSADDSSTNRRHAIRGCGSSKVREESADSP